MTRSHAPAAMLAEQEIWSDFAPVGARESVGSLLARNVARLGDHGAFAERSDDAWRVTSWRTLAHKAAALARFLTDAGIVAGDRVVVFSPNRGEMLIAEFAVMSVGATYVPIFSGYAPQQATELVAQSRPSALIVANVYALAKTGVPPGLRAVVTFDHCDPQALATAVNDAQARSMSFADALIKHAVRGDDDPVFVQFLQGASVVDPGSAALMMYTSGTSGRLKGVLLSHDCILSQQRSLAAIWTVTPDDRFLSYLPWHHSFGGIFEKYTALYNGATIHIDDSLGKDLDRLFDNWRSVQPSIYFSVPKIYQQLVARVESRPDEEPLIFHAGLRWVFTAAAALPAHLAAFFAARKIPVIEGWGLTETSPCCTLTDLVEPRTIQGMVGYPIPGVRVRIAPDGEILVHGPNVMIGYFDNPEETHKALPGDGWFRTGDLGALEGAGLRLVSRRDRVFKLANAEKVIPTSIELRLAGMNSYIRHVIVVGSGRDYPAAVVFPDFYRIAEEFGGDRAAAEKVVKESIRKTVIEFNSTHPVKYERIHAIAVVSRELSIERNELTPSLKVRVGTVLDGAWEYIDATYEPTAECDCKFLRKILRVTPDDRLCFNGKDRTLSDCHSCGSFIFDDDASERPDIFGGAIT
jgi:long-subunit acyl-CoA synthetase (AMP-forming)